MNSYVLSRAAEADIEDIAGRSIAQWGFMRAERYLLELHRAFETLADFPHLGRDASHLRCGYFRFEHQGHSVFYRKTEAGVFIVRVLHQRQQPENYL
jgi:toxin ParE1/3/4